MFFLTGNSPSDVLVGVVVMFFLTGNSPIDVLVEDVDCDDGIIAVVVMFFLTGNSPSDVLVRPFRGMKAIFYVYNICIQ